jgi:hypothetical protein
MGRLDIFDDKNFGRDNDPMEDWRGQRDTQSGGQEPKTPRRNGRFLGFDVAPPIGPRVLMEKKSSAIEFFYRIMYLVFLAYSGFVIATGLLSVFAILGQMFVGPLMPWGWIANILFLLLLFNLGHVRDFWEAKFDLYRMDANFSGVGYLKAHLDSPHWEYAKGLFGALSQEPLSPIDKEALRRQLTRLARDNASIYEAIYELADDRLRWTLVHAKID